MSLKGACIFVLMLAWLAPGALAGDEESTLNIVSTNYPPFYSDSYSNSGAVAYIVATAFKRRGYNVSHKFYPFIRATLLVKTGKADGIVGLWYRKEREQWAAYSQPIVPLNIVLYKRKDSDISYQTLSDLQGLRIGVGRGYANPVAFTQAKLVTEESSSDELNMKKLFLKRIDLVLIGRELAQYIIRTGPDEYANVFEEVGEPLSVEVFHFGASKSIPGFQNLIKEFNLGLESMRRDGSLEKILRDYELTQGLKPSLIVTNETAG
ncbi:transporter substrate-binding domain-containing protein [Shewanella sp. D64]|uniref:substrate-binding periplasmic protein n=1 Tax=unclassified Shewanella TaxID=196818 RepID=UPI0022BA21D6|nr:MULTISPECIES: transporter substrate-binding domain-containing protein [unclassified Shewanella]MEC4725018.1 transporter substrate-binding domain-containing protein [Shewanella sp. D64]MEC4736919.1 transporter substrate-binding domain-containing protein [Shewanella sp. E94]WBJ96514.1 transporter substrate-binding domain-containing protein [Shewanella sp. MTB7]